MRMKTLGIQVMSSIFSPKVAKFLHASMEPLFKPLTRSRYATLVLSFPVENDHDKSSI